jgi:hypothetical protein
MCIGRSRYRCRLLLGGQRGVSTPNVKNRTLANRGRAGKLAKSALSRAYPVDFT